MKKTYKVIDFSTLIPGPFASYLLSKHFGFEVLKIEEKRRNDDLKSLRPTKNGIGLSYQAINKGKKILTLDIGSNGKAKLIAEIKKADIFIHNYKASRIEKYGLGFDDIIKINPDILYIEISGYPQSHPFANKACHDLNILALTGYLDTQINPAGFSYIPPLPLADLFTSYKVCLLILKSLLNEEKGKFIQVSLIDSMLEAGFFYNYPQLILKKPTSETDYIMSGIYPCYHIYKSRDSQFVAVACLEPSLWADFCHHLKREDLIFRQSDIKATDEIASEMKKYSGSYWLDSKLDFCVTPVLSINKAKGLGYVR